MNLLSPTSGLAAQASPSIEAICLRARLGVRRYQQRVFRLKYRYILRKQLCRWHLAGNKSVHSTFNLSAHACLNLQLCRKLADSQSEKYSTAICPKKSRITGQERRPRPKLGKEINWQSPTGCAAWTVSSWKTTSNKNSKTSWSANLQSARPRQQTRALRVATGLEPHPIPWILMARYEEVAKKDSEPYPAAPQSAQAAQSIWQYHGSDGPVRRRSKDS